MQNNIEPKDSAGFWNYLFLALVSAYAIGNLVFVLILSIPLIVVLALLCDLLYRVVFG